MAVLRHRVATLGFVNIRYLLPSRRTDMQIITRCYKQYEYDVQLTPLDPSRYDPCRVEARVIRIVRVLDSGDREPVDELLFRIAAGRDQHEAIAKVDEEVRRRVGP